MRLIIEKHCRDILLTLIILTFFYWRLHMVLSGSNYVSESQQKKKKRKKENMSLTDLRLTDEEDFRKF